MDIDVDLTSDRTVLSRAAKILEAFSGSRRVLSLNALTERSNLPKSTTHRLAGRLVSLGWLERQPDGYRIGMSLFEAGRLAERRIRLRESVFPSLQDLAMKTQLATSVAVLSNDEIVVLDHLSASRFRLPIYNGARLPATCTALGKALLARGPADALDRVLDNPLPRRTDGSIVDPVVLANQLVTIQETGVAVANEEAFAGISCVAAPLCVDGGLVAAISISGPGQRIDSSATVTALLGAVRAICADYGTPRAMVADR